MLIRSRMEHNVWTMQGEDLPHRTHVLDVSNYRNKMLLGPVSAELHTQFEQAIF